MKEKSKNAARTRRKKENDEFIELSKLLPLSTVITQQLDKASVIRLTTSYLKMRQVFPDESSHQKHLPAPAHNFESERTFALRMKCVLSKKDAGLVYDFENTRYKVIHFAGYLKARSFQTPNSYGANRTCTQNLGLVAVGQSFPSLSTKTITLNQNMFMFRASMDLKLTFLDEKVSQLTGFSPQEMNGNTLYQYIHPEDIHHIHKSHSMLRSKEQIVTKYYRFLTNSGGWIWIQSYLTVIRNDKSPICVVSVNYVLSNREANDLVPIAVLKIGEQRVVQSNLKFPEGPVTFKLVEGSGPVIISGLLAPPETNTDEPYPVDAAGEEELGDEDY